MYELFQKIKYLQRYKYVHNDLLFTTKKQTTLLVFVRHVSGGIISFSEMSTELHLFFQKSGDDDAKTVNLLCNDYGSKHHYGCNATLLDF